MLFRNIFFVVYFSCIRFINTMYHPREEDTMASKINQKEATRVEDVHEDDVAEASELDEVFNGLDSLSDD